MPHFAHLLSVLMAFCSPFSLRSVTNLHAGITRRGILSREFAISRNNGQAPAGLLVKGCLLYVAVDFRCFVAPIVPKVCQRTVADG